MARPFNQLLHDVLTRQDYKYEEHVRFDRYQKDESIVLYYVNNYIVMIEGNDVAPPRKYLELAHEISGCAEPIGKDDA